MQNEIDAINARLDALLDDDSAESIAEQERLIERERELRMAARPVRRINNASAQLAADNMD